MRLNEVNLLKLFYEVHIAANQSALPLPNGTRIDPERMLEAMAERAGVDKAIIWEMLVMIEARARKMRSLDLMNHWRSVASQAGMPSDWQVEWPEHMHHFISTRLLELRDRKMQKMVMPLRAREAAREAERLRDMDRLEEARVKGEHVARLFAAGHTITEVARSLGVERSQIMKLLPMVGFGAELKKILVAHCRALGKKVRDPKNTETDHPEQPIMSFGMRISWDPYDREMENLFFVDYFGKIENDLPVFDVIIHLPSHNTGSMTHSMPLAQVLQEMTNSVRRR